MMTDKQLAKLLKYDFSKGHEEFKEALLARCLAILDEDGRDDAGDGDDGSDGSDGMGARGATRPLLSLVDGRDGTEPSVRKLDDEELLAVAGGVGGTHPQRETEGAGDLLVP